MRHPGLSAASGVLNSASLLLGDRPQDLQLHGEQPLPLQRPLVKGRVGRRLSAQRLIPGVSVSRRCEQQLEQEEQALELQRRRLYAEVAEEKERLSQQAAR